MEVFNSFLEEHFDKIHGYSFSAFASVTISLTQSYNFFKFFKAACSIFLSHLVFNFFVVNFVLLPPISFTQHYKSNSRCFIYILDFSVDCL